jgi:hypothetical protein
MRALFFLHVPGTFLSEGALCALQSMLALNELLLIFALVAEETKDS